MNPEPPADSTTTELIWRGVEAPREDVARLQPPWPIPPTVAIKADIGHHHRAPEVISHSLECLAAGASAVHLHVRDDEGRDTGDIGLWREVVAELRAQAGPDVVIDSGLRGATMEERLSHIRERLFDTVALIPTWRADYLQRPLEEMKANGVMPELCIWDATDIALTTSGLLDSGLIERPAMWLIVPSTPYYGMPMPTPELMVRGALHLVDLIRATDPDGVISFSAAGRPSSYLTSLALLLGLHVRPGIGETHWRWPHSVEFADQPAPLIEDAVAVSLGLGRRPASAQEFRRLARLPTSH